MKRYIKYPSDLTYLADTGDGGS